MPIAYWLRWLGVFPAAMAGALVANILGILFNSRFVPDWFLALLFFQLWQGVIFGAAFVWIGAKVAPTHRFMASIILALVLGLFMGGSLTISIVGGATWQKTAELIAHILGNLGGAAGVCFHFHSEEPSPSTQQARWEEY